MTSVFWQLKQVGHLSGQNLMQIGFAKISRLFGWPFNRGLYNFFIDELLEKFIAKKRKSNTKRMKEI